MVRLCAASSPRQRAALENKQGGELPCDASTARRILLHEERGLISKWRRRNSVDPHLEGG